MFKTCFQRRADSVRTVLLCLVAVQLVSALNFRCEGTILYLFTKAKFNWTEAKVRTINSLFENTIIQ